MDTSTSQSIPTNARPTIPRIRFPGDAGSADKYTKHGPNPLNDRPDKTRSFSYISPATHTNVRAEQSDESNTNRRRVRSVNAANALSHARSTHAHAGPSNLRGVHRRVVSHQTSRTAASSRGRMTSLDSSIYDSQSGYGEVTEDKDDPNVIADLQKALMYKADVEDRLKAAKPYVDSAGTSPSVSSTAAPSSNPFAYRPPFPTLGSDRSTKLQQELVDFSPSVARAPLHPVPVSSNDGATLDWSGIHSEEDDRRERKWSVSLTRRASKEKSYPVARKAVVEQQTALYADKIARIRRRAQQQTLVKAEITADQLKRRYAALKQSNSSEKNNHTLIDVVRWFDSLDASLKRMFDEAEPLTWLRHLRKDGPVSGRRSPWIVPALVAEEYMKSSGGRIEIPPPNMSSGRVSLQSGIIPIRLAEVRSRPESMQSIEAPPYEGHSPDNLVSFEPITSSRRSSGGTESHNSLEANMRRWRNSITRIVDSPRSSANGILPAEIDDHANSQKSSSEKHKRVSLQIRPTGRAEETLSTTLESSRDEVSGGPGHANEHGREKFVQQGTNAKKRPRSTSSSLLPSHLPNPRIDVDAWMDPHPETPRPFKSTSLPAENKDDQNVKKARPDPMRQQSQPALSLASLSPAPQRWTRRSLPSSMPASLNNNTPAQRSEVQENTQSMEYSTKRETLEALKAQNMRIKQLLLAASKDIAEHDELQTLLCSRLNLPYTALPLDVLDAFNHDPSAVTGNTRSSKGWRAVEDIHSRIMLQKQILQPFVNALPRIVSAVTLPNDGLYRESIQAITETMDKLQSQRQEVQSQVVQLSDMVTKVKEFRDQLKPEYESAGKQTSAAYPELIQLESHLDKFVTKRNRFWKLAETSLSFALSWFAPFMKTFGRPIWDDLHDFLVIPWYRNDFSGEEHWYPVTFPKRKVRHWIKLTLLVGSAPLCLKNAIHLLVNLLTQGYSVHIPFAIPWFVIYTVYLCALLVLTSFLAGLFFTVLAEVAIISWWSAWALRIVQ